MLDEVRPETAAIRLVEIYGGTNNRCRPFFYGKLEFGVETVDLIYEN